MSSSAEEMECSEPVISRPIVRRSYHRSNRSRTMQGIYGDERDFPTFEKCPFSLACPKRSKFTLGSDEEIEQDFRVFRERSEGLHFQKEISAILNDDTYKSQEYEQVERCRNPFYKNLEQTEAFEQ